MTDETGPAETGGERVGAPADPRTPWGRWPRAVVDEVVRRTAAGEAMRAICRDPAMPAFRTVMKWMATRPRFRAAIEEARLEAGRSFVGRTPIYCRETAEIIFQRLCAGEGLVRMCREDPSLPAPTTIYRWMAGNTEFRQAVALAREIAAEGFFEKGWELAEGATPETAYATDVKLKHLRWHAGKLSPRKYGELKPAETPLPYDEDDRNNLVVVIKDFVYGKSEEENEKNPARVLYTMKRLPQTPAARRDAELERAEMRLVEKQKQAREAEAERERGQKEQALEAEIRKLKDGGAPGPERSEDGNDPEGWR